jgi:cbb3-type cytochrome oxidase maturation protein
MTIILVLLPVALLMGFTGLMAFMWSLRNGQYDDLEGAAVRAIMDDDEHMIPGREPENRRR